MEAAANIKTVIAYVNCSCTVPTVNLLPEKGNGVHTTDVIQVQC